MSSFVISSRKVLPLICINSSVTNRALLGSFERLTVFTILHVETSNAADVCAALFFLDDLGACCMRRLLCDHQVLLTLTCRQRSRRIGPYVLATRFSAFVPEQFEVAIRVNYFGFSIPDVPLTNAAVLSFQNWKSTPAPWRAAVPKQ
jgi:hypothetical protein